RPAPAHSAPTARSAGPSQMHSPSAKKGHPIRASQAASPDVSIVTDRSGRPLQVDLSRPILMRRTAAIGGDRKPMLASADTGFAPEPPLPRAVVAITGVDSVHFCSRIGFALKWCSRQAEFHHILGRGISLRDWP